MVDGKKLGEEDLKFGPVCWDIAADLETAYLIRMTEPSLFRLDLTADGPSVTAVNLGRMIEGKGYDSRGSLTIAPDGRVYAVIRVDNQTGFGAGYLHHLVRYEPDRNKMTDLGVLAVSNPEFLGAGRDTNRANGVTSASPHHHGFHVLPDGTLTPLHHHMACRVARDGTVYVTILYPFTLLRIAPASVEGNIPL